MSVSAKNVVGGALWSANLVQLIVEEAQLRGVSFDELYELGDAHSDRGMFLRQELVRSVVARRTPKLPKGNERKVVASLEELIVNYDKGVHQAIVDGKFNFCEPDITSANFPILPHEKGVVLLKTKVFCFNCTMTSTGVFAPMNAQGYRPAKLLEQLAYAAANPEEQRLYPIVALGSIWQSSHGPRVPCLRQRGIGRTLDLEPFERPWPDYTRFLAVPKCQSDACPWNV